MTNKSMEIDYEKLADVMLRKMNEGKSNPPAVNKPDTRPAPVENPTIHLDTTVTLTGRSTKTKMPMVNTDVTIDGKTYFVHVVERKG